MAVATSGNTGLHIDAVLDARISDSSRATYWPPSNDAS